MQYLIGRSRQRIQIPLGALGELVEGLFPDLSRWIGYKEAEGFQPSIVEQMVMVVWN